MRPFWFAIAIVVSTGATARAQPQPEPEPQRVGLMIELDGGLGYTYLSETQAGDRVPVALALGGFGASGVDIGVGVFATPDLAVLVRMTAETFYQSLQTTNHIAAHSMIGPAAEWWIDDTFYAGAGVGLGVEGGQDQDGKSAESQVGYGVTARGGFAFSQNEESAWRASIEGDAGFLIGGRHAYTVAVLIGWQSF